MFIPVLTILNELEAEPSTLLKADIIRKYKDHKEFRMTLTAALDPLRVYHIKKIPDYDVGKPYRTLAQGIKALDLFSSRGITGNRAIRHLEELLQDVEFDDAQVIERIIKKDLRCNVGAKLVNKALGYMEIPVFGYSGCNKFKEATLKYIGWPAYIQTKMDGLYANSVVTKGKLEWITRQGQTLDLNNKKLEVDILALIENGVYGGELLISDEKGGYLARKIGNGIINKLTKFKQTFEKAKPAKREALQAEYDKYTPLLRYVVWDYIPLPVFRGEETATPAPVYSIVHKWLSNIPADSSVKYVETEIVNDQYEAEQFFDAQINKGREGAVLKDFGYYWKNGKHNTQLKMKVEDDAEFRITAVIEGTGKFVGKLGAFSVVSLDGEITANVGTGFTDEEREKYYDEKWVGKLVTVKYNEVIVNSVGRKSLYLPVMLEVDPMDK